MAIIAVNFYCLFFFFFFFFFGGGGGGGGGVQCTCYDHIFMGFLWSGAIHLPYIEWFFYMLPISL